MVGQRSFIVMQLAVSLVGLTMISSPLRVTATSGYMFVHEACGTAAVGGYQTLTSLGCYSVAGQGFPFELAPSPPQGEVYRAFSVMCALDRTGYADLWADQGCTTLGRRVMLPSPYSTVCLRTTDVQDHFSISCNVATSTPSASPTTSRPSSSPTSSPVTPSPSSSPSTTPTSSAPTSSFSTSPTTSAPSLQPSTSPSQAPVESTVPVYCRPNPGMTMEACDRMSLCGKRESS